MIRFNQQISFFTRLGPLFEVMAAQPKPMMAINKADQFLENFKR
jgi:hypothetical protein